jgi:hypothetical protein
MDRPFLVYSPQHPAKDRPHTSQPRRHQYTYGIGWGFGLTESDLALELPVEPDEVQVGLSVIRLSRIVHVRGGQEQALIKRNPRYIC